MIWVYVVVLTTGNGLFTTAAPNITFSTQENCQMWREQDMNRLLYTRPTDNHRAISQCFGLPFDGKRKPDISVEKKGEKT
tara:strand:- start:130 stop:369 length:240 start_codon:yes stop_codon:yes gene_type:complete